VLVRGIVTGDFRGSDRLSGFWLQSLDEATDGLPAAVFVYAPGLDPQLEVPASGMEVVVAARSSEYRGRRQLSRVNQVFGCGSPGLPGAIKLDFPTATETFLQRHDGLLVRFATPLTVTGNRQLPRYGSMDLATGGRLFRPTNAPPGAEDRPGERRRVVLDDGSYRQNPRPVPYLDASGTRRSGSRIPALEGILTYAFDDWRVHPLSPAQVAFEDSNPRPDPPAPRDGPRVAAFNVENYFLTLGERGANTETELDLQRRAMGEVAAGLGADLIGLVEVENLPRTVDDLVRQMSEYSGIEYRHFEHDGPVGTDAIRVALAWNGSRVELLGGPFIDSDRVHHRPPVVGHFRFGKEGPGKLVAVIHHKAKTGCPESGDVDRGQGCWNLRRTEQSRALAGFLSALADERGTDRVLIVGDANAYGDEDPIHALREAGFADLIARHLPVERRYTYVFRGESGYLDHALATPSLVGDIGAIHIWHINADEPHFLQHREGPWRSSDHDPVVVDFR
jgi:predicted extracellular nuclease